MVKVAGGPSLGHAQHAYVFSDSEVHPAGGGSRP